MTVSGAGEGKTIINGSGIDYTTRGYYGLVDIADERGAPTGTVAVSNLTVDNAIITADEARNNGQSPIEIDNEDSNPNQPVVVTNALVGGTAVESTLGGIGYYSLSALTPGNVNHSTFQHLNQAILFEGAGAPLTVTQNTFQRLVSLTQQGTAYAPQGVFQLSDEEGTNTLNVSSNTFTGYAGYGVASGAGYTQGNCTPSTANTCTGTAHLQVTGNTFALTGSAGAAGIYLHVIAVGDAMNATLTGNTGSVAKPSSSVKVVNSGGLLGQRQRHRQPLTDLAVLTGLAHTAGPVR